MALKLERLLGNSPVQHCDSLQHVSIAVEDGVREEEPDASLWLAVVQGVFKPELEPVVRLVMHPWAIEANAHLVPRATAWKVAGLFG